MQAYYKKHANVRCNVEYAVGDNVLLSTKNLRLHGTRMFHGHYVGPFVVLERIGKSASRLDLSSCAALRGIHNMFHVLLLHNWLSDGVIGDTPTCHQSKLMARQSAKLLQSRDIVNIMVNCNI